MEYVFFLITISQIIIQSKSMNRSFKLFGSVLILCMAVLLGRTSAQTNIVNADGSEIPKWYCYDSIDYEITVSPYVEGAFDNDPYSSCGVFQRNGKWYFNPVIATTGITVFPWQCYLTYYTKDSMEISKSIVIAKPVIISPPLTDLSTCNGHFELGATALYAGPYTYQWLPGAFLERPDTAVTKGFIQTTQKFTLIVTDQMFASQNIFCTAKDSLVVHMDQVTKPEIQSVSLDGYTLATKTTYGSYQWLHEGKHLLGATEPFLVVRRNGNYQVIGSNGLWCSDTSDNYNINTVSIEEYRNVVRDSDIYPNPATNMLHLNIDKATEVYIFSIEGKLMKQYKSNNNTIYIGELPKGIYLIHLKDIKGEVLKVDRFVKL